MLRRFTALAVFSVSILSLAAQGQSVFVLPGPNAAGSLALPFSNQFSAVGTGFTAGSGAFQAFAKPDGTEFYIVGSSTTQTITSVQPGFQNPVSLGGLGAPATTAAMTPDGSYLLVVAGGSLFILDTSTDKLVNPSGTPYDGGQIVDLALSLDGSQAFVLTSTTNSQGNSQGTLYSVSPATGVATANLAISNIVTSVSVGPNDLVYVGGVNRVYEITPTNLTITTNGQISLNAKAGRAAFTPDGKYALIPNLTPGQAGSGLIVLSLATHSIVTLGANLGNSVLSQLLVPSNGVAFGYSSVTQTLYQFSVPGLNVSAINFGGVPTLNLTAVGLSNEVAEGANASPAPAAGALSTSQYLYIAESSTLYRVNLTNAQLSGTNSITNGGGAISVLGPIVTGISPSTLLQYGTTQILGLGATSLPLVVQALDPSGNPISGATINFALATTSTAGAKIKNPTVTTGTNGYAVTTVTGPSAGGPVIVTATGGNETLTFNLQFGGTSTGGGGGTPGDTLSVIAGQGQLFLAGFGSSTGNGQPLTVKLVDANGNPIAGVPVTWEPIASNGQALGSVGTLSFGSIGSDVGATKDGFGHTVNTNSNGEAAVNFQPAAVVTTGFLQTQLQASAPNAVSVTFYASVTQSEPGPTVRSSPNPGTGFTGSSGSTIKGAIQIAAVTNEGNPIPNVAITAVVPPTGVANSGPFSLAPPPVPSPDVSCANPTGVGVLTNNTGTATCDLVINAAPGTYQFSINVGLLESLGPFSIVVTPGAPATVQLLGGNNQSGAPGQTLSSSFVVKVLDANGNPLAGQTVYFQILTSGSITLQNVSAQTNSSGEASAQGILGPNTGTFKLQVTAGSGSSAPSAQFTYTIAIPTAGINATGGTNQTAQVQTAFASPLTAQVVNSSGAGVSGVTVTFAASNGAVVNPTTATTDSNGNATTNVTAGTILGPLTVTASAAGFSTSFSLTVIAAGASNVVFLNGASYWPGISPGVIATIQATNLLPGFSGVYTPQNIVGPLPTSVTTGPLSGLSITFNGVAAPIFGASNENGVQQVTVQVPFETAIGTATVVINSPGGGTATVNNVPIQAAAPGVFVTQYNGQNFAVAVRASDGSYISPSNPIKPGDTICIFATGLGQTNPPITTDSPGVGTATLNYSIDLGLDNAGVPVVSANPLAETVGVYLLCMEAPRSVVGGASQPVGLVVHTTPGNSAGDFFAPGTSLPIQ